MEEEAVEEESGQNPHIRARHIKKRSLKNKALAVSFNEKDLKDYVTGFHKRKKKRRKEAQQQVQESDRRKRIELRKKRKLEREFAIHGGAPTDKSAKPDEAGEDNEQEEETEPIASVSGTTMYDNGDVKVMVTTSAITHEEDLAAKPKAGVVPKFIEGGPPEKKKNNVPVTKKKPFKRVAKKRSRPKPQSKREKRKVKNQGNKKQ
ncbi:hypothetical protein LguiA_015037 [Lonicera macranthoides]